MSANKIDSSYLHQTNDDPQNHAGPGRDREPQGTAGRQVKAGRSEFPSPDADHRAQAEPPVSAQSHEHPGSDPG